MSGHFSTTRARNVAAMTDEQLYDLMSECGVEPANPTICDSCAAYIEYSERETRSRLDAQLDRSGEEYSEFVHAVAVVTGFDKTKAAHVVALLARQGYTWQRL